ncbi:MAG: cobyrinate a,c-diamide synthase [Lachnospiraceae bacterium]|jgi:cobyrinic acid a,c-diamide synthase|nr:cobyrinate a,c-diamide synthase [Lachnospiraceae bacterium]
MKLPRIMIAAPSSGSGKTLITCGILKALVNRGLRTASFKCGPDYIDPMFHSRVIGTASGNLDTFFTEPAITRYLFGRTAREAEISVVEGVMGYFDGLAGISTRASSADLAKTLNMPVVLLVNCRGLSVSVLPLLQGFLEFEAPSCIRGVILNQVSPGMYPELKGLIEERLPLRVLGYVPRLTDLVLESRHLGLVLPGEVEELQRKLADLAGLLEKTLDLNAFLELAREAPDLKYEAPKVPTLGKRGAVTVGVAEDEAFCFTYRDNLQLLEEMGARLVAFSPLHDRELPRGIQGLILSGGYPELYGEALSKNAAMRDSVFRAVTGGMPCIAECGGFLYLHKSLEGADGKHYPMAGVVDAEAFRREKLTRFGYVTLEGLADQMLLGKGEEIRGHEFHYWDSESCGESMKAKKPLRKRSWTCVHGSETLYAGFPHLFFYSNPQAAWKFLKKCEVTPCLH